MTPALLPLAAIGAGILSATSPCVLPVLPGYLAAVSTTDRDDASTTRPSITGALGFVIGFTAVFTVLGATASAVGSLLFDQLDIALKIAGVVLIVLGLHTVGIVTSGPLDRERRLVQPSAITRGRRTSVMLGGAFAIGWTPCIGPILATVLTLAAADSSLAEGMGLLLLYSLGLGIPFIALALWFDRSAPMRRWLTRRARTLQVLGGSAMIAVGVGYLTGIWSTLFTSMQTWLAQSGWPPL